MTKIRSMVATCVVALVCVSNTAHAQVMGDAIESVQIRGIDLTTQVLELHNFGTGTQTLDDWRFCTHDELDGFDYTSATGLNGLSLDAGESLFVHWNNDAAGPNAINIAALGGAAVDDLLADTVGSAVSIGLYRGIGGFGSSSNLVDHVQYSFGGTNVGGATPRGSVAEGADLWTSPADWISVDASSTSIALTANPFPGAGASHGPSSYAVIPEPTTLLLGSLASLVLLARRK
ncbi:MAG: hypothetical protein AAGD11_17015 [Planctomycetota bacterium]